MKVLIIEDEPSLRSLMSEELRRAGYVVQEAETFGDATLKLRLYEYDCILLDIMLPDGSGLRILEELEAQGRRASVIIISARDALEDRIAGLEKGADDYLPKPFDMGELLARIRSVLRRRRGDSRRGIVLGNVRLDPEGRRVEVEGRELTLLKKEFDILSYLMQRPGHMVDKAALAEAVWGDHADQADSFQFVDSQMKNLRRKLAEAGGSIEIASVYGFGYKLLAER